MGSEFSSKSCCGCCLPDERGVMFNDDYILYDHFAEDTFKEDYNDMISIYIVYTNKKGSTERQKLTIHFKETVESLKKQIRTVTGIAVSQQEHLRFKDQVLTEDKTEIWCFGIHNNSVLYLN